MKKIIVFILSTIAIFAQAAPADEFTPRERQELMQQRDKMIASCKTQVDDAMSEKLKKNEALLAKAPSVGVWMNELFKGSEFCTCSTDRIMGKMTPRLLRSGTQAEAEALGMQAAAECALPRMKTTFPAFCDSLLNGIVKSEAREVRPDAIANICGCVQTDVDAITPETLPLVMKATALEKQALDDKRETRPNTTISLGASFVKCGLGDLLRK